VRFRLKVSRSATARAILQLTEQLETLEGKYFAEQKRRKAADAR
jgi:hypothetical protein